MQQIPSSSPILPSTSIITGQQDGSMMSTNMQHQLGPMPSPLQHVPQSPSTQPPQQSPRTQQLQLQQLHPSQPLQSVAHEDMMDIDTELARSPHVSQKTAEGLANTTATASRQVPPIAPAINMSGLSSSLNNQVGKVLGQAGKPLATIFSNNANFPETSTTIADVDMEDAGAQHLLPKRKVQQLVDQIDPKERLEPEVEEVS